MAKDSSTRSRRCVNCGADLPMRRGRPAAKCPTCGAAQTFASEPLRRRKPTSEFGFWHIAVAVVGGVIGLWFGCFFAWTTYRRTTEPLTLALLMAAYAVGCAILGAALSVTSMILWSKKIG